MRKSLLAVLALALVLILGALPAAASQQTMLALAEYFPTTTSVFFSARIDSETIAQADSLAALLDARTGALNGMNLSSALDMLALEIDAEGTFESVFGWVGDALAFGITSPDFALPENQDQSERFMRFVVSVRDPRAAEAFMDSEMPDNAIKEQVEGGILYRVEGSMINTPVFFLNNAVMIIVMDYGDPMRAVPSFGQSLADMPEFATTIEALPLSEYHMLMVVDPLFMVPLLEEATEDMDKDAMPVDLDFAEIVRAVGHQALGATVLDGRSLVLDMTSLVRDRAALESLMPAGEYTPSQPLDLSFTGSVPANTSLLLQYTGMGSGLLGLLAQVEALAADAREQMQQGTAPDGQQELVQAGTALALARNGFRGLSGLSLNEAFGWMDGNFAVFMDLTMGSSADLPVIPNIGIAVENTDTGAAAALFASLPRIFTELGVDAVDENGSLVVSTLNELTQNPALDLLFALNDRAFVTGTRPAVEGFIGAGGLADTAAFQFSSSYFLPGSQFLAWIHVTPLANLAGEIAAMTNDRDAAQLAQVLPLLESATLTAAYDESGSGAVRGVLTLAGQ